MLIWQVRLAFPPAAGGNIAAEAVVRAPGDGYTLLLVGFSNAVNATLFDKLNFNFIRERWRGRVETGPLLNFAAPSPRGAAAIAARFRHAEGGGGGAA